MENGKDHTPEGKLIEMPLKSVAERDGWIEVQDDGRWIVDLPSGPFAVLPCDACKSPAEMESSKHLHYRVGCPKCGKHTPEVIRGKLLDVLELWNEMVCMPE